ncbi:TrlF family AAA-like ATPase [Roseovarius sp. Pro17]|uniref:TrlF family AAA-like ATPase n=1 Tax=Roseovarius sp. Pro17 TaxID=3108175 RepID=UPI002D799CEC|nr:AAA family ATPase [Roseovarius sp. Pro17]
MNAPKPILTTGSIWRRWDPHIHAPGTTLNDQFGSNDVWEKYLSAVETSEPKIEGLGVTDYYLLDTYKEVLRYKTANRLADVTTIFPNIELRLTTRAGTGFVNIHLLIDPTAEDHVGNTERLLARLEFEAHGDTFKCAREDLIRLGRKTLTTNASEKALIAEGANQFKVEFSQLKNVYRKSDWAKANVLVAVAGGKDDGTSGLRQASDATLRAEIEKFAHVIFASSVAQREFWTGKRPAISVDGLKERYGGCKPCLHGCDAHRPEEVGQPAHNRYSWVKGAPTFDALRQACIDPEYRAFVEEEPPAGALPSQVIQSVAIADADWAKTDFVPLNPGLVAIIGARGSGKTALADMIAAVCDAVPASVWSDGELQTPSFLSRARPLIGSARATLTWGSDETVERALDGSDSGGFTAYPRARYLSQQFVEELCSPAGISDGLVHEIERVVYQSYDPDTAEGATSFTELRNQRTERFRQARDREEAAIDTLSDHIATELENGAKVADLEKQIGQKDKLITDQSVDKSHLKLTGKPEFLARHEELSATAESVRRSINLHSEKRRAYLALQDEVASVRATTAPEMLRETKENHLKGSMSDEQWGNFLLVYNGDVDATLRTVIAAADQKVTQLTGDAVDVEDRNAPLIPDDQDLATVTLNRLTAELERLSGFITADDHVRKQWQAATATITRENAALEKLKIELTSAQGAGARRKVLQSQRIDCYERIFQAIINEQLALQDLYQPLLRRLEKTSGTLGKLRFTVTRIVDVEKWGRYGEANLFDKRRKGATKGVGSLTALAADRLAPAWQTGTAADVRKAMETFMETHAQELLSHAPYEKNERVDLRNWMNQFAHWLFATDHITVRYEINYDGVDIRKLSPGTRGIVLLLLYLALDDQDDRPLIIDQPEENLDPKSVNDELVPLFIEAKKRRQVIMVTHNANLVVNTDADQIIIAEAGPHPVGGLPPITYYGAGLESQEIRAEVCKILEGGEPAFQDRARRLRVRMER